MIALTFTVELVDPLLATAFGAGDPNSKSSLAFVPGSMVRGALIERYLAAMGKAQLDGADDDERRRFLGEGVRYLHLYPQTNFNLTPQRLLPVPRSLQQVKSVAGQKVDEATRQATFDWARPGWNTGLADDLAWKSAGGADLFCWHNGSKLLSYSPLRSIMDHTTRQRRPGRATRGEGNLFRYDALAAGERLAGVILSEEAADIQLLQQLLNAGPLVLGGARGAGYGRVRLIDSTVINHWQGETGAVKQGVAAGDLLILTAWSAWFLTGEDGFASADLDKAEVAKRLGIDAGALEAVPESTRRGLTTVGGFNRMAGLPLPQQQAVAAGSTFAFRTQVALDAATLQKLQEGIGLLQHEGFGRVGVNWQATPRYQPHTETPLPSDPPVPVISSGLRLFAEQIGQRMLRQRFEEALLIDLGRYEVRPPVKVSGSQLSRLRLALRLSLRLLPPDTAQAAAVTDLAALGKDVSRPLVDFLAQLKPTAQEQLERAPMRTPEGGARLLRWVQTQAREIAAGQAPPLSALTYVQLGNLRVEPPPAWRIEYSLRLMDGVLAQAVKNREGE